MKFDKIVIEGPNNVGKSSLIEELRKYLNWEVEHVSSSCPNDFKFYDDLLSCDEPLIFDRLHLGEMVYPEIYNRKNNLSENEFDELCEKHCEHTLTVVLDADFEFIIMANVLKDEHFNYNEVWQEKKGFYNIYEFCKCTFPNCIRLKNHLGKENTIKLCKKILEAIGFDTVN
jgi:thymidylate kinase